jgi:hypothetical protein
MRSAEAAAGRFGHVEGKAAASGGEEKGDKVARQFFHGDWRRGSRVGKTKLVEAGMVGVAHDDMVKDVDFN